MHEIGNNGAKFAQCMNILECVPHTENVMGLQILVIFLDDDNTCWK